MRRFRRSVIRQRRGRIHGSIADQHRDQHPAARGLKRASATTPKPQTCLSHHLHTRPASKTQSPRKPSVASFHFGCGLLSHLRLALPVVSTPFQGTTMGDVERSYLSKETESYLWLKVSARSKRHEGAVILHDSSISFHSTDRHPSRICFNPRLGPTLTLASLSSYTSCTPVAMQLETCHSFGRRCWWFRSLIFFTSSILSETAGSDNRFIITVTGLTLLLTFFPPAFFDS